jgi:hypothetical protein
MYGPHGQLSSVYSISASVMCKFYFKIHILLLVSIYIFLHQYCLNNKIDITIFLTPLKRLPKGSKITNLRSIYHPERHDYDVAKMGFKTGAGKT